MIVISRGTRLYTPQVRKKNAILVGIDSLNADTHPGAFAEGYLVLFQPFRIFHEPAIWVEVSGVWPPDIGVGVHRVRRHGYNSLPKSVNFSFPDTPII